MKTIKKTLAKLAFVASFALVGMNAQAQITASSGNNLIAEPADTKDLISYKRPLAFEAIIKPELNAEKVQLIFGKMGGTAMTITLFDNQDQAIFYRTLDKNEKGFFKQDYDIKNLPEGDYHFVLRNGSEKLVKKFEIRTNFTRMVEVL